MSKKKGNFQVEYKFGGKQKSTERSDDKDSIVHAEPNNKSHLTVSLKSKLTNEKESKITKPTHKTEFERDIDDAVDKYVYLVDCCSSIFGEKMGNGCEKCMEGLYWLLAIRKKDFAGRARRIAIFGFNIVAMVFSIFFVVVAYQKYDERKFSFFGNIAAFFLYFLCLVTNFFISKLQNYVFAFGLLIALFQADTVHVTNNAGLLDGCSLALTSLILYLSFYTFDSVTIKLLWILLWFVNIFVMLMLDLVRFLKTRILTFKVLQPVEKLVEDLRIDYQNKIISSYVSIFGPTFVSVFSFLFRSRAELTHVKTKLDKHKETIVQYGKIGKDELSIIIQEKEAHIVKKKIRVNQGLFKIDQKEIKLLKKIGKGGSEATIYKSSWRGKLVAFKVFKIHDFGDQDSYDEFEKEVNIMSSIAHPNVLQFFGCTLKPPRIGIVMEFCAHGDLQYFIGKIKLGKVDPITFEQKIMILRDVCSGMEYLHNRKIIHRDMKCQNVLLRDDFTPKIIDFGLSRLVDRMSVKKTMRIGTCVYMAPEVILGNVYDEFLTENFSPYGKDADFNVEMRVANDETFRPEIPSDFLNSTQYEWYIQLMKKCWSHNATARGDFEHLSIKFTDYLQILETEDEMRKLEGLVSPMPSGQKGRNFPINKTKLSVRGETPEGVIALGEVNVSVDGEKPEEEDDNKKKEVPVPSTPRLDGEEEEKEKEEE